MRYVRTPEGARFYKAPIGSPIIKDKVTGKLKAVLAKADLSEPDGYGSHRPAGPEYGAPFWKADDGMYPEDVYSPDALKLYGSGPDMRTAESEVLSAMRKARGNPDYELTIYRAVSPDDSRDSREGDWVTPSKAYADQHGRGPLNGKYVVRSKKVKARTLWTEGNSLLEWGYHPEDSKTVNRSFLDSIVGAGKEGGFTVSVKDESFKRTGFAVAKQGMGDHFSVDDPDFHDKFDAYIADHWDTLTTDPEAYLGGWVDTETGEIWLDVPEVTESRKDAYDRARQRGEIAIADLAKYANGEDGEIRIQYSERPPAGTPAHDDWMDLNGVIHKENTP